MKNFQIFLIAFFVFFIISSFCNISSCDKSADIYTSVIASKDDLPTNSIVIDSQLKQLEQSTGLKFIAVSDNELPEPYEIKKTLLQAFGAFVVFLLSFIIKKLFPDLWLYLFSDKTKK